MERTLQYLEDLVRLPGPAGFEHEVVAWLVAVYQEVAEEVTVDRLGNLVARLGPDRGEPRVALVAHSDEVGFLVNHVLPGGQLGFRLHGRIDPRVLPATRVHLCTPNGPQPGVIVARSAHLVTADEALRAPEVDDLWIDIGAADAAEVAARGIHPGTPVVYAPSWERLGPHMIAAKALDNRVNCALQLALATDLAGVERDYTLYLVVATQEEIGSRGAQVVAQWLQPDLALVLDTVAAADHATPPSRSSTRLGQGPVIRTADSLPWMLGTVYAAAPTAHLQAVARTLRVPFQHEVATTWTDAATLHLAGRGVPCAGLYIPRLGAHSPVEIMALADLQGASSLVEAVVRDLTAASIARLIRFLPG